MGDTTTELVKRFISHMDSISNNNSTDIRDSTKEVYVPTSSGPFYYMVQRTQPRSSTRIKWVSGPSKRRTWTPLETLEFENCYASLAAKLERV